MSTIRGGNWGGLEDGGGWDLLRKLLVFRFRGRRF